MQMPISPQMIAQQLLQAHPEIRNNPNQMQMLQAILNNDAATGQQLASNFCQTYGTPPQQAVQQAQSYFQGQMMPPNFGR